MNAELIDAIVYLLSAAVGWFARWLKDRKRVQNLRSEVSNRGQIINRLDERNSILVKQLKEK